MTLDQLKPGQCATILNLTSTGLDRRRMMDLGLLPGTQIAVEMRSPLGDPIAYNVRGTVIALRNTQARDIMVEMEADAS